MDKEYIISEFLSVIEGFHLNKDEEKLSEMYNISRKCITLGIGVIEFVELYMKALKKFFLSSDHKEINIYEALSQFPLLREGLSPYELTYLSYIDSNQKLTHLSKHLEEEVRLKTKVLNVSKQQFQALVEHIPGIIYTCSNQSPIQFEYISPKLETFTGFKPIDWIKSNKQYLMQIDANDIESVINGKFYSFNNSKPYHLEYRITTKDGKKLWVSDTGHFVVGEDDNLHIQGIISDISQQKNAEKEMMHNDRLENVRSFAENMTHDFNNLLNLILTTTQDALIKDPSNPISSDLHTIQTTTRKASALINKMLDFSKISNEKHEIVDINDLITKSEELIRIAINKSIKLSINLHPNLFPVKIDPISLEQVLINLVINANDSMPNGGNLEIKTESELLPTKDEFGYISDKPFSIISVRDTGVGMSENIKAKIFDPFFTTKKGGEGTGLGLSGAWKIINQAGGKIVVISEIGKGTTFRVFLPPEQNSWEDSTISDKLNRIDEKYTILLVDDMESFRKPLSRLLSTNGFKVLTASSASEALALFQETSTKIDLVICDTQLPDMVGTELVGRIRELKPEVKALHISGYISNDEIENYTNLNQEYLQKPFSVEELTSKIAKLLA